MPPGRNLGPPPLRWGEKMGWVGCGWGEGERGGKMKGWGVEGGCLGERMKGWGWVDVGGGGGVCGEEI